MSNCTSLCLGRYLDGGAFMARCVDCGIEIGTFRPDDILEAVRRNLHRGGVKCPKCRRRSCVFCGLAHSMHHSVVFLNGTYGARRPNQPYQCCAMCTFDHQDLISSEYPY